MDQTQKVRIGLVLAALAVTGVCALLASHGVHSGALDEIGGGFPT